MTHWNVILNLIQDLTPAEDGGAEAPELEFTARFLDRTDGETPGFISIFACAHRILVD